VTRIGRVNSVHLVLLLCVLLASASVAAFRATGANATPLERQIDSVGEAAGATITEAPEAVTAPVHQVTETIAPPINEVTETGRQPQPVHEVPPTVHEGAETAAPPHRDPVETVTRPAREATETVARPAREAVETVTRPAKEATETAKPTVERASQPVSGAAETVTPTVDATAKATGVTDRAGGALNHATAAGSSSPGGGDASVYAGAAPDPAMPQDSDRPGSDAAATDLGPGDDTFDVPSLDGSVRAPLGRLMYYVWPAVSLTGPGSAKFLRHWEQGALRLALETPGGAEVGSGADDGPVVAGVHASGGQVEASSGHSLFSKVPSAVRNFFSPSAPLPMFVFLLTITLAVLAVFAAVGRETGFFDRHRRR
jgi:hypothetical protein